ncbi:cytochrome P450 [Ilyonectria destructans]|nr:cytochrome P450 [Ilyonectria destructans]
MMVGNGLGSGWGLTTMLQSALTHFTIEPDSVYAFLLGLSVGLLVYSIFVSPVYLSPLKHLPGPKDNAFFFGQTLKFLHVPWFPNLYLEWSRQWPDAPFIRYLGIANTETLFVNSIVAYKEILQTKSAYFVKPKFARTFAHETIGDGLPFVEGQLHKLRRAAMMRTFSVPSLKASFAMVQEKARQWTDVLSQKKNEAGDVEITFGQDFNHLETDGSPLYNSFTNAMKPSTFGHIVNYINSSFPIRKYLPIQELREAAFHREKARDFIRAHVSARLEALRKDEATNGNAPDALQYLVEHSDSAWGKDEIVEYVLNLMVLGLQQRLRDEMKSLGNSPENAIHNIIDKLPLLHNFVREVLRLYCATAMVPREATCDIDIAGVPIPKGTVIQLSPAVMNLHPSVWGPTAGDFDPDRWDTLSGAAASPFAFETFHNGPRMCIGKKLAIMEMKVMIVELVGRFRIEADGDGPLEIAQPTFTLRPKEKLVVRLVEL